MEVRGRKLFNKEVRRPLNSVPKQSRSEIGVVGARRTDSYTGGLDIIPSILFTSSP